MENKPLEKTAPVVEPKGKDYDMSVAQDVVRALAGRGMINLNGIKAVEGVGGDIAPQSKSELPDMKEQEAEKQKNREERSSRVGR